MPPSTPSRPPARAIPPRTRKLIGAIALLVFVIAYSLLAMAAAIVLQVNQAGKAAEFAYSVLAGLLWVPPAAWIIWWMQRTPGID